MLLGDDDKPTYDVSAKPGITPQLNWQIDAGIYLELSIFDWLKEFFGKMTKSNAKAVLSEVAEEARNNADWYKEYSTSDVFFHRSDEAARARG